MHVLWSVCSLKGFHPEKYYEVVKYDPQHYILHVNFTDRSLHMLVHKYTVFPLINLSLKLQRLANSSHKNKGCINVESFFATLL